MTAVDRLFDTEQIAARVRALAREIAAALPRDLLVVGILKGSFVFVADLVRALDQEGLAPEIDFVRLSSYGHETRSAGTVRVDGEKLPRIAGRNVLVVDDIVDTGRSLLAAKRLMAECGAARVWTCALLDKPSRREVDVHPDFLGFPVPDVFVVGYGIDYAERYRHLPYIGAIR